MLSKIGMIDSINELRKETGRHTDLVTSRQLQTLWNIYQRCTKRIEFKKRAKDYLEW